MEYLAPGAFLLLGALAALTALHRMHEALAARRWPRTRARIAVSREVESWSAGGSEGPPEREWRADLEYRYQVAGREYTGRRVSVNDAGFATREAALGFLSRFPVDGEMEVRFHPRHPERALVTTECPGWIYVLLVVGLLFCATGGFLLVLTRG